METETTLDLDDVSLEAADVPSGFSLWPVFVAIAVLMIGVGTWRVLDENAARDAQTRAVAKSQD